MRLTRHRERGFPAAVNSWWIAIAVLVGLTRAVTAATTVQLGTDATKQVLRGTVVTTTQVFASGEVVIDRDLIVCVAADCADPPNATIYTVTDGFIYPGFIDAHNHVAYNVLPKWTPPRRDYRNRGQWQDTKEYKAFKQPYNELKNVHKLYCEMVKYGEIKALITGITAIQGTSPNGVCFRTLIRNVENQSQLPISANHIRTHVLPIDAFKGKVNFTVTKAFVVHLAEGVDQKSKDEFQTLKKKQLLQSGVAIIHGTAFGDQEFLEMGQVGGRLIWSPQSNLALYSQTTNIPLALKHGVEVSLGVDWNPSGSDDIFGELRVAQGVNEDDFGGVIGNTDWLRMITSHPARALGLEGQIGTLAAGAKADITVLRERDPDPHVSLRKNRVQDVEMVWVGGQLLYGRESVLQKVKPKQCEALNVKGTNKRICVSDTIDPVVNGTQTLAQIRGRLLAKYPQLAPLVP
jgi:5-methylthioadenosine/S-adenosylhomocysteine deaminase